MENKYFVPEISDIHVGYECYLDVPKYENQKFIVTEDQVQYIAFLLAIKEEELVKVPYLTKEQIESEGWTHIGGKLLSTARQEFTKNLVLDGMNRTIELSYNQDRSELIIGYDCGEFMQMYIFQGTCKCINDFRLIIKMLCIKN